MEKIWFIYADEVVSGPFTTENVEAGIKSQRWKLETAQIWWKGQKEWLSLSNWKKDLKSILNANKAQSLQKVWYAERYGIQVGPMTKAQLIAHLGKIPNLKGFRLWTVGLNYWTNLFEFHEILEQLGISKRSYDRVPIVGHISIEKNGEVIEKNLASVSGGGLGIKDAQDFKVGEILSLAIHSALLVTPIRATAQVMYVQENGYAGLQFQNIHIESQATLLDYIKQFRADPNLINDKTLVQKSA